MRAILVSVDYWDFLEITLPWNRHRFEEVMVVTSHSDWQTEEVAKEFDCEVFKTEAFYDDGADFNKWKALEQGLDAYGRYGWLCVMDPDILWPKSLPDFGTMKGCLYTPRRRLFTDLTKPIPMDTEWNNCQLHPNSSEWAGYSQIFHAEDEHLGNPPWHEINWKHAGGADSFFQRKWPISNKIRPPFEVLHLGMTGRNWTGRTMPYLDGTVPERAEERKKSLNHYRQSRVRGAIDPYSHEKFNNYD